MRVEPVTGKHVWTAAELIADPTWTMMLDPSMNHEARAALARVGARPLDRIDAGDFILPVLGDALNGLIDQIEGGRGVALIRGLAVDDLDETELEQLFWGLAAHIGIAEPQDSAGKRLHHVCAERSFADADAVRTAFREDDKLRGYQTNAELHFHGDGSDALFFLCHRTGRSGGLNRIVSAGKAFNAVLAKDPSLAITLQKDFAFDARGELGPGRLWQLSPVFMFHEERLSILYKRGYIDLAQRLPGVPPLTGAQLEALGALDEALNDPDHYHEFLMQPGDILIANNYNVLHARTHFIDHDDPARRRHMLRIWATLKRNRRPLPPALKTSREFAASHARRIALGDPL